MSILKSEIRGVNYTPSAIVGFTMFKVSTKGDYGLLVLSAIAEKTGGGVGRGGVGRGDSTGRGGSAGRGGASHVSLKEIAKSKKLSLSYISQIIIPLKRAGLVESKEGRDGGYRLARPAAKISIMEILEVLEGPISPVRCCDIKNAQCGREDYCNVKFTWNDAKKILAQFLRTKTLADTMTGKIENGKWKTWKKSARGVKNSTLRNPHI